jgi:hypothetical protein
MPCISVCSYIQLYAETTEPHESLLMSIQHAMEQATQKMGVPLTKRGLKVMENDKWQDMPGILTVERQVGTRDIAMCTALQAS